MAAECRLCGLIAAMDRLWFDQIILFSEPPSFLAETPPQSILHSSKDTSKTQEIHLHDEIISSQETEELEKETATNEDEDERPSKYYSSSSLISAEKRSRNIDPTMKKSSSCKSLMDLELEEVKGFMDLGFTFRRENMTKRMIHLVPGLHRIESINGSAFEDEDDEEAKKEMVMRPYLSEAWIMRKPLLNMRIPAVSKAAEMKKHLKYWAHTVVASAIHQQS